MAVETKATRVEHRTANPTLSGSTPPTAFLELREQ